MQRVEAGRQARAARLAAMTPAERVALAVRFGEGGLAAYEDDPTDDRYGAVADRSGVVHAYEKGLTGGQTMATPKGHTTAIRAGKAIGTSVYDPGGNKIGEVKDIVLEKTSNNILFAVVGFGGVLGMGDKYHPLPWSELDYDPDRGGYVVSFTADQLKSAPADSIDELTKGDGRAFRDRAYQHYGTKPYWQ